MIGTKEPSLAVGSAPAVNLLPRAERQRRSRANLIRRWGWLAVAAVAVMVLISAGVTYLGHRARVELDQAQQQTYALSQQLAGYGDVSRATRIKSSYDAYRTQAMDTDLSWSGLLGRLQSHMPAGAQIVGFDAATEAYAASTAEAEGTTTATTMPAGTQLTATLTVASTGAAPQQAMLTDLRDAPGVLDVELTGLSSDRYPSYTSTVVVYFDDSVFSQRYAGDRR